MAPTQSIFEVNAISHAVVDVGTDELAQQAVAAFARIPDECGTVTDEDGTSTTFAAMSFPDLGDDTTALLATATAGGELSGLTLSMAVVVTAEGQHLSMLVGVGNGADGELLTELATTTVERLQ